MSQYQPPNWDQASYDPSHPYYRPPRRGPGPVLIVLLVLGVLGVLFVAAVVGMVALVANMDASLPEAYGDHVATNPPHVHDWAAVRAGYDPDSDRPSGRQLPRLQTLVDEFARCGSEPDVAGLQKIVDFPRFYREMKQSRFAGDVQQYDRASVLSGLVDGARAIEGWERIAIVDVQPLAEPGELIVYGLGVQADGYTNPVRFWVIDGRTPKLYDWEMVDYGVRDTGDWSIVYAYVGDSRIDDYHQGLVELEAADDLWAAGEVQQAEQKLRAAEQLRVPPPHRDGYLLSLIYKWLGWGRYDQVSALIARAQDKDAVPGLHLCEAQAMQQLGQLPESLDVIAKYEVIVGQTVESLRLKAEVCRELERWEEAARHRRALLNYMPDSIDELDAWANELREDEAQRLADHVETLDDPIAAATSLATRLAYRDDVEGVRVLADFVEHRLPGSASAAHLAALVHYAGNEFEEAAPLFLKVYQKTGDDDERETARYRYLECMATTDEPLAAYQQSDKPKEDFLYFAQDYEYGDGYVNADQLRQLVEAHLRRVPDDPWGYYYVSYVEDEEKQPEDVEAMIRRGIEVAEDADDEEAAASLQDRLLQVMVESGRAVEAYEANSPGKESFRQLAGHFRYDEQRPVAELDALIARHETDNPDDPRIPLYQAISAQRSGDLDLADKRAKWCFHMLKLVGEFDPNAYTDDDEELLRNDARDVWIGIRIAADRVLDAYREIPPAKATFDTLAGSLYGEEDWSTLEQLIAMHEAVHPDDPQLLHRQAQLAGGREQHAEVARLLHPWPARADELSNWYQTSLREQLVESLLAEDRTGDAREAAERIRDLSGNVRPLIKVCILAGDTAEAKRLIEELRRTPYALNLLYDDEDIRDVLLSDTYADVRRKSPPGLGYGSYGGGRVVLLQEESQAITAEQLREAAGEVLAGDVHVEALEPNASPDSPGRFIASGDEARVVVWQGEGKYQPDADLAEQDVTDKDLLGRWERHGAWTAIDVMQPSDAEEAGYLAYRLAARLMDENVALVHTPGWLLPAAEEVRLRLTSGDEIADADALGDDAWLYHEGPTNDDEQQWQLDRPARLRELDRAFAARQPGQEFHIQITLNAGHASQHQWLKLIRVERSGYRDRSFVGEFTSRSLLRPHIPSGEHVRINSYEINNWRITDGDETTLARSAE